MYYSFLQKMRVMQYDKVPSRIRAECRIHAVTVVQFLEG
jgi:hypothetical protein